MIFYNVCTVARLINKDMEGYELEIPSDIRRRNLIKDSKFYNLRHLTESLIPARTHFNPFRGNAAEIVLSIGDFRATASRIGWVEGQPYGWMEYKRLHDVDKESRDLIVQIDDDGIIVGDGKILLINRQANKGIKLLKETAEGRKAETHTQALLGGRQEIALRIEIPTECHCVFDGKEESTTVFSSQSDPSTMKPQPESGEESHQEKKRKLNEVAPTESPGPSVPPRVFVLKRSMWRVKVRGQPPPQLGSAAEQSKQTVAGGKRTMVLVAIKLEGWTREKEFAKEIAWL
jgi:hypothetical protein